MINEAIEVLIKSKLKVDFVLCSYSDSIIFGRYFKKINLVQRLKRKYVKRNIDV